MNYIEIYQLDVLNLPAEITYAHNVLLGLAPPTSTPLRRSPSRSAPTGLRNYALMNPGPIVRHEHPHALGGSASGLSPFAPGPRSLSLARFRRGAEEERRPGLNSLPEVEFKALSQHDWNPLGARALAIHPADWKHGETEHFIYHFIHSYVATPISVEAEFNYRVIAKELGLETMPGASGKSHIYIFEKPDDWKIFQSNAHLEPWTGGIHSLGSLFIVRDPSYQVCQQLVRARDCAPHSLPAFTSMPLPRWLDEGFAEYVSRVARASYQRARNYNARPRSHRSRQTISFRSRA